METLNRATKEEIAATAARLAVEEGLDYGPAKRRAIKLLGLPARTALPGNDEVDDAVRAYVIEFCADTQPRELASLRQLALRWMQRMKLFRPHLGAAVWRGTATRNSDIQIDLFCDDPKSAEIALIDLSVNYESRSVTGLRGECVNTLSVHDRCPGLGETVGVHLRVYDHNDLRGALRPDAKGRAPRGDLAAVLRMVQGSGQ